MIDEILRNDGEITQAGLLGLTIDVLLLGARVRQGRDLCIGENFGKVERTRTPSTPIVTSDCSISSLRASLAANIPKVQYAHPIR
jgi:hypothetical protein